jgi:hypothetical protein
MVGMKRRHLSWQRGTVGALNSIRLTFQPTTLIVMIAIGAGLMFLRRRDDDDDNKPGNGSD